jgi:site-specific DNA-adenine methylase
LETYNWCGDEFVYADPPYLLATRGGRRYYDFEMEDSDHLQLLRVVKRIPAPVMISGYPSAMYDDALAGWNREEFTNYTRARTARQEVLWFNYPRPDKLHDHRYTGSNYRERWRIQKKRRRWRARLLRLPVLERATLYAALVDVMDHPPAAPSHPALQA